MQELSANTIQSKVVNLLGSDMHYLESGEGEVILFIHGMPTSSYVWRHVIPNLSKHARCIAIDLMGMGDSAKPEIDYSLSDHVNYLSRFIEALRLSNITLVLHGWGSVIGLDYASRNEEKIKAVALYESHIRAIRDAESLSLPIQQLVSLTSVKDSSYQAIVENNYLIDKLLPACAAEPLSLDARAKYAEPFQTPKSREVLWKYINELPLGESKSSVIDRIQSYSSWLQASQLPKLLLYAVPGFITTLETISWAKEHLPSLTMSPLDDVMHLAQESAPDLFSEKLTVWFKTGVSTKQA